jgi:hypothetical protein
MADNGCFGIYDLSIYERYGYVDNQDEVRVIISP